MTATEKERGLTVMKKKKDASLSLGRAINVPSLSNEFLDFSTWNESDPYNIQT